jgi:hypothetical protein
MWAPASPERPEVNSHVRREAAVSADASLARAIDRASVNTTSCKARTTVRQDVNVELEVVQGVVKTVTRQAAGGLLQCVMGSLCEVSLGAASGKATVAFHLRPMSDSPKVKVKSGTVTPEQQTMVDAVREAAAACEQGQLLKSKPTSALLTVGASPHSSMTTMTIDISTPTELNECMTQRLDGLRLPFLWQPVGSVDLAVTWDG